MVCVVIMGSVFFEELESLHPVAFPLGLFFIGGVSDFFSVRLLIGGDGFIRCTAFESNSMASAGPLVEIGQPQVR